VRTYGNRALVLLVRVTSHQGAWEGHVQGEAAQEYDIAGGRARDVHILNWRNIGSGEPHDAETVPCGSGRGGEKRPERDLARRLLHGMVTERQESSRALRPAQARGKSTYRVKCRRNLSQMAKLTRMGRETSHRKDMKVLES
jgi:hypothetical protein